MHSTTSEAIRLESNPPDSRHPMRLPPINLFFTASFSNACTFSCVLDDRVTPCPVVSGSPMATACFSERNETSPSDDTSYVCTYPGGKGLIVAFLCLAMSWIPLASEQTPKEPA